MPKPQEQLAELRRGAQELHHASRSSRRKLARGKPLRVKAGFDPTAPDLHLGHTVLLNKMRQFQELGHEVIFLIGDFTGPDRRSRRVATRRGRRSRRRRCRRTPAPTSSRCSRSSIPRARRVDFNSRWFGPMSATQLIELAAKYTVARMLERDDFEKRYRGGQPIAIHEFLYPLVQGYDSVALQADVELGGTDQKFNLLVGRHLQEAYGQEPQVVLTMPLLEGLDGVNKMSKSLGNYIGIAESAGRDVRQAHVDLGRADVAVLRAAELPSARAISRSSGAAIADGRNPRDVKFELASEIVARFHGAAAAAERRRRSSSPASATRRCPRICAPTDGLVDAAGAQARRCC